MSKATQGLRYNIVRKDFQTWKEPGQKHKLRWGPPGTEVRICLERARLLTESYKITEGQPEVIRRAKALAHILENMSIYIKDGERIVGNFACTPSHLPIMPEIAVDWLEERVREEWDDLLDEAGHSEFKQIIDYWRERCIDYKVKAILPEPIKRWITYDGSGGVVSADEYQMDRAWVPLNYEKVLRLGLEGIIEQAEQRLNQLRSDVPAEGTRVGEWVEQVNFLEAVLISCHAAIKFTHRFVTLAQEKAEGEQDAVRKRGLLEIAENCERVPKYPAVTLHQALQSWWFVYLISRLIETTTHGTPCRFDQLMNPYYRKDREESRLSREEAQELVEHLWVKIEEIGQIAVRSFHVIGSGVTVYTTFTLGGVDENGQDATNDFSLIMVDASIALQTCQTNLALRYHPKISYELVLKAIDCIRTGIGYPAIFNDRVIIDWLVNRGVPFKLARNYCIPACVAIALPGKNVQNRIVNACLINLAKCFELALNEGRDIHSNKQLGYSTPDPLSFTSIEDIMDAYLKQVNFAVNKVVNIANVALEIYSRYGQLPFSSALIDGSIEKGKDITAWAEYPYHHMIIAGAVNIADSLAAIKKLVFEDRMISMDELLNALRDNFEQHEELRQKLLNQAPKFGNDDDYVDLILREVMHRTQEEVEKFTDLWGYPWTLDSSLAGAYYGIGRATWALPDGKREGRLDTLADGTISPNLGRDKKGPTAVIKSMGKVDPPFSMLANQKFMPQFLEGENKEKFASYLKTWAELGGWHIQFNVVDKETLVDAQKNPEKHPNLIVRVAGYSAYFIDLPKGIQDQLIDRTAQCFM